ncbi:hypothetical protein KHQ84_gp166 [Rhodococcus phage Finch]|uniref:Uncharacterized protein n=1 Tax=Rhodococcus phage Finch TaxID=2094144 RepID=A0A2P1JXT7_9CAUD|nr:hypothetical protein KHQ84_gp166 [Rhodococcus phage Finch]AVO25094.1 hypothetical protein SEA_FINCH_166 [Rhodococcus phage Finch]
MTSRLLKFFGFGHDPAEVPDSLAHVKIDQNYLAKQIKAEVKKSIDLAVKDAVKTSVDYWLYETEEGKEVLLTIGSVIRRYPAVKDAQIEEAISEAVLKVFQAGR